LKGILKKQLFVGFCVAQPNPTQPGLEYPPNVLVGAGKEVDCYEGVKANIIVIATPQQNYKSKGGK
jgi:hypothetical protein